MINSLSYDDLNPEESPEALRTYEVREFVDTPRSNPEENEDALLIHKRSDGGVSALILDGATGVGEVAKPYMNGMANMLNVPRISGGRFASLVVKEEIEALLQRGLHSPKKLLLHGAQSLRAALQQLGVEEKHFTQVASTLGALVDIDSSGSLKWACIRADVSVLILRTDGTWEWHPADHPLDYHEGKALSLALQGSPTDISNSLANDPAVQDYINQTNRAGENVNTYGSLNGADSNALDSWIEEGGAHVNAGDRVYLFTDGFLPEKGRRAYESEVAFQEEQVVQRQKVVEKLETGSVDGLLDLVRRQQKEDLSCAMYPRFKAAGDDATLIEIQVK